MCTSNWWNLCLGKYSTDKSTCGAYKSFFFLKFLNCSFREVKFKDLKVKVSKICQEQGTEITALLFRNFQMEILMIHISFFYFTCPHGPSSTEP